MTLFVCYLSLHSAKRELNFSIYFPFFSSVMRRVANHTLACAFNIQKLTIRSSGVCKVCCIDCHSVEIEEHTIVNQRQLSSSWNIE